MSDDRTQRAIDHLRGGTVDDLGAALKIVRELEREARETPEEQRRRRMREASDRAVKALAPAAAAYARAQERGRA